MAAVILESHLRLLNARLSLAEPLESTSAFSLSVATTLASHVPIMHGTG